MLLSVSEKNFSQEVLNASEPVLVHFCAPWCGLCRAIVPCLLKFQADSGNRLKIVSVNADENFRLANTYRLGSLPTLILFERGHLIDRLDKISGRDSLQQDLEKMKLSLLLKSA